MQDAIPVRPSQLALILSRLMPQRIPALIVGKPGIGKSDIVAQVAAAAGADLIISHPAVEDPTDSKGLPIPNAGGADFVPLGNMRSILAATRATYWFIDDFGQAAPAVQASYMQWLLARRCGSHVLPDCVSMVLASNGVKDRANVTSILAPVLGRLTVLNLQPTLDDWSEWAIGAGISPQMRAFMRFRGELLSQDVRAKGAIENAGTPRNWARVDAIAQLGLSQDCLLPAIAGCVGTGPAAEYLGFLRVWQDMPSIDGILMDPVSSRIPTEPSALYAVTAALSDRANATTFGAIFAYAMRMQQSGLEEFAVLLCRDAYRRNKHIVMSDRWTEFCTSLIGKWFSGQ